MTARLSALVLALMSGTVALATVTPRNTEPPPVAALFDCEVPCFLGIVPGETTVEEAEEILLKAQALSNIEHIYNPFSSHVAQLTFTLDEAHPVYRQGIHDGMLLYVKDTGIIWNIQLSVQIPLSTLHWSFGEGNLQILQVFPNSLSTMVLRTSWVADTVETHTFTEITCPFNLWDLAQMQAHGLEFLDTDYGLGVSEVNPRVYRGCQ